MLALLWRILMIVLVGRLLLGLVRLLRGPARNASQRPREVPRPKRPAGDIVDAEFEDIPEGKR